MTFQGPPSFSSTFKALNLQHLNSSTFTDFQGPVGTLHLLYFFQSWVLAGKFKASPGRDGPTVWSLPPLESYLYRCSRYI